MRLYTRVLLAQLPALLVILALVVWGGQTVDRLGAESQRILAQNYRSVLAAERMKESIERLDSAALFRLVGSAERAAGLVTEHEAAFETELRIQASNITEPGEAESVERLRVAWIRYQSAYDALLAAPPADAPTVYFSQVLPAFQAVKDGAQEVLAVNQDAMRRKSDEAAASAVAARRQWLAGALVGLGSAMLLGAVLSHRVTVPLGVLAKTAERVGDGQLDVHLPSAGIAELDALASTFDTMATRLREYRRAGEGELARARESAQAAIESLVDPVVVLTPEGEIRATNGAARRVLGIASGQRLLDDDGGVGTVLQRLLSAVVSTRAPVIPADFTAVVLVETAEGERALLPHATPIQDAATGTVVGVTVLLQDVTRLRRLDELKGDLVQTAAHELRTPLTSLRMALHLALDERVSGPVGEKQQAFLTSAQEDVQRLRALVEDLLDLSRIQEGRMVLHRESVPAGAVLEGVAGAVRAAADAAGVEVEVEVEVEAASAARPVSVDKARLHLALTNLAANAVRHSPRGAKVRLRAVAAEGVTRFEVDDAGAGVPAAERERIFGAFMRGADAGGPGAGLGLYIAREVVRAHGGRIGVTDAPSGGARFWVELPE
ncbi:MAG: ATP-binding protein [Pseudomonadota bacterium]|nr:ATP-binding protein [Pseudomonadota bacterium]